MYQGKRMAQWFSGHTEFRGSVQSKALETLRASTLASGTSLDVYPSRVVDWDRQRALYWGRCLLHTNQNLPSKDWLLHFARQDPSPDDCFWYLWYQWRAVVLPRFAERASTKMQLALHLCQATWQDFSLSGLSRIPRSAELWDLDLYSAEVKVM